MFRHQTEPRGGGQPEGSDDNPRGEADSPWSHQQKPFLQGTVFVLLWEIL